MKLNRALEEQNISAAAKTTQLNQAKKDLLQKMKASEDIVDIVRLSRCISQNQITLSQKSLLLILVDRISTA